MPINSLACAYGRGGAGATTIEGRRALSSGVQDLTEYALLFSGRYEKAEMFGVDHRLKTTTTMATVTSQAPMAYGRMRV